MAITICSSAVNELMQDAVSAHAMPLQFSFFFLHGPQGLDQCGYMSSKEQMLLVGYIHYGPTPVQDG
jgi:hypothetical protein